MNYPDPKTYGTVSYFVFWEMPHADKYFQLLSMRIRIHVQYHNLLIRNFFSPPFTWKERRETLEVIFPLHFLPLFALAGFWPEALTTLQQDRQREDACNIKRMSWKAALRIHDIFGWIRIRGSCLWLMDSDPAIFVIDLQDASKKLTF